MDPQLKSALTTIAIITSSSLTAWASSKGFIQAGDQTNVANALVAAGSGILTVGLAYMKTRDHSPTAIIQQVNTAENGVKVVAENAPAPTVDAPILPKK
jgi:hypothetical protein